MTTAASEVAGKLATSGPATKRTMTTHAAAAREYTWVRAPEATASAVRDPEEDTG